jgi:hypothetical protein
LFAGADSTHVLDLVIRNTERMVVLPTSPLYMECSERELSFAILDVAAALSRPDLAIAMRSLVFLVRQKTCHCFGFPQYPQQAMEARQKHPCGFERDH